MRKLSVTMMSLDHKDAVIMIYYSTMMPKSLKKNKGA